MGVVLHSQRKTTPTQLLLCFDRLWSLPESTGWCLSAAQTLNSGLMIVNNTQVWMNSGPCSLRKIKLGTSSKKLALSGGVRTSIFLFSYVIVLSVILYYEHKIANVHGIPLHMGLQKRY
jgi:hypothetical protein